MLNQAQIDFYNKEGYVVIDKLLSDEELSIAHQIINDFIETSKTFSENTGHFDLEPDHTATVPKVRRMANPATYHPFFDGLMRDPRILACLSPLIGTAIRAQGNKLNMKPAAGGSPVEWHQDFAHYPHTNDNLCAVGIALDDNTTDNGAMMVVPRSHQGPILDHHQDGIFIGAISPQRDNIDLSAAVPLEMQAGSVSIHHARTLHGSALNLSGNSRRLLLFQYAAVDAWPLGGVSDWERFNEEILQGEATYEFRSSNMTLRTRLPAGPRTGGGIYELQKPLQEKIFAGESN